MLEKYELHEFVPLVDGIRKGDLRKFNDALVEFQHHFIRYSFLCLPADVDNCLLCQFAVLMPSALRLSFSLQTGDVSSFGKMQDGLLSQPIQEDSFSFR